MAFYEKITRLRKERGLSQESLAAELNVSRQAVSKWETGDAMPDVDKIVSLAEFFEVTTDWLLRDIQPEPVNPKISVKANGKSAEQFAPLVKSIFWCVSAIGLALLFHGRFVSQSEWPSLIGLVFLISSAVLPIGYAVMLGRGNENAKTDFLKDFWRVNIWFTALLPASIAARFIIIFVYNNIPEHALYWLYSTLPYPVWTLCRGLLFLLGPAVYTAVCLFVSLRVCRSKKDALSCSPFQNL